MFGTTSIRAAVQDFNSKGDSRCIGTNDLTTTNAKSAKITLASCLEKL